MFNLNILMLCFGNKNTIGITKSDILSLINIVKRVHAINNDNNLNDTDKFREVFITLENYHNIVDACDIINDNLIDIDNNDYINIKLIEEL